MKRVQLFEIKKTRSKRNLGICLALERKDITLTLFLKIQFYGKRLKREKVRIVFSFYQKTSCHVTRAVHVNKANKFFSRTMTHNFLFSRPSHLTNFFSVFYAFNRCIELYLYKLKYQVTRS
jgi:hypothetical protein